VPNLPTYFLKRIFNTLTVFLLAGLILGQLAARPVAAQGTEDPWTLPVNLSHSGAATNPAIIADSSGIAHVIWEDTFAGLVYTRFIGDAWQSPTRVAFPFAPYIPTLVADGRGLVHAFWVDDQGRMYLSRAGAANFGNAFAWETPRFMAEGVLGVAAAADQEGNLHLVYLRTLEGQDYPAGIYYRRSTDGGEDWYLPDLLYQSAYFRSLNAGEANLHLAAVAGGGRSVVYVVWDNRPRRQVYFVKSENGGETWGETALVAGPDPRLGSAFPFDINTFAQEDAVLLTWKVGEPGASCQLTSRWSHDRGENWSESLPVFDQFSACPQGEQMFGAGSGLVYLMVNLLNRIYLLAWDGEGWSEPQAQDTLSGFEDPEIYTPVTMGCHQAALVGNDRLVVVGCDLGGGGDVWGTSRQIGDTGDWFPPPPVWSPPEQIATGAEGIASPVLLANGEHRWHAFWRQAEEAQGNGLTYAGYYARWDGERWTRPVAVLASPGGHLGNLSAALDAEGRLLAAWDDASSGKMYISWADAERANSPLEWSAPLELPAPHPTASQPVLLAGVGGRLYLAYALPLNEGRGVYLAISSDSGQTWSDPVQVFDAVAEGWERVGSLDIALARDGSLHLLWTRAALPGGNGTLGLYYAASQDGGQSWSAPDRVVEADVLWSRVVAVGERTVHRIWQEERNGRPVLNHQFSPDGGLTWSRPSGMMTFGDIVGRPALAYNPAGRLHLLQATCEQTGFPKLELNHWLWDGERWRAEEGLSLDPGLEVQGAAAAFSPDGALGALLVASLNEPDADTNSMQVYFSLRDLALPGDLPSLPPLPTPEPTMTPTPGPTPTPTLTPLPPLPDEPVVTGSLGPIPLDNNWVGLILGGGLGVLLVLVGFGVRVYLIRNKPKGMVR